MGAGRVSRGEVPCSLDSLRGGRLLRRDKISIQQNRTTCRLAQKLIEERLHKEEVATMSFATERGGICGVTDELSESSWKPD